MELKFIIKQSILGDDEETIEDVIMVEKKVKINSLDDNLFAYIEKITPQNYLISFGNYYTNYGLMAYDQTFPYMRKKGIIKWNVSYDDVSISEFLDTNELTIHDPILVEVEPNVGGADIDYSGIIDWIITAAPFFENGIDKIANVITITEFVLGLKKHFANKEGQIAETGDVRDALHRRKLYTENDLEKWLGVYDKGFIKAILIILGYKHIGKKYFYSKKRAERLMENEEKYAMKVWGKYGQGNQFDEFCHSIHDLNISLTILMCESNIHNSECFAIMQKRIELLASEYSPLLKKGKKLKFLKSHNNKKDYNEELVGEVMNKIYEYSCCIDDMCCYLKEKDN